MKMRKVFAIAVSAALLAVTAGCGVQETGEKVYEVGVLQYADHPSLDNCREGFIEGLKAEGFEDGKNLKLDLQSAKADDATNTQVAQKFAADGMDLVCGIATPPAQALYNSCYELGIPVVFNAVSDPVSSNLANSKTEAMDGITGVSDELPVEEQLKLIREMLPNAKTIGILYTTSEANSLSTIKTYEEKIGKYGFELVTKGVANAAEIPQAAETVASKADCLTNLTDNTVVDNLNVVLEKAQAHNIPVFGSEEEQVGNGCIASAGIDYVELGRKAGVIAARVLKGEDIASIPYETMTESKITVNPLAAEKVSVEIPQTITERAEVKESV